MAKEHLGLRAHCLPPGTGGTLNARRHSSNGGNSTMVNPEHSVQEVEAEKKGKHIDVWAALGIILIAVAMVCFYIYQPS